MVYDFIKDVDFSKRPYLCTADSGDVYTADTVIICTGAKARWLGLPGEEKFRGLGVSACATCDGFFFKGKEVAVVGGGSAAVEEALFLTNFCTKVTLIHRRDTLRAEKIAQDRLFKNPKIEVIWDTVVEDLIGDATGLTGLALQNIKTGTSSTFKTDGLFVAIGHVPATGIFVDKVKLDSDGYIITAPDSTATNIPGVFAAGDVKDRHYRQAVTAAGMGCMAALEADRYIAAMEADHQLKAAE